MTGFFLKGDFHFLILSVRSCTQYTTPNNANTHTHPRTYTHARTED